MADEYIEIPMGQDQGGLKETIERNGLMHCETDPETNTKVIRRTFIPPRRISFTFDDDEMTIIIKPEEKGV